MKELNLDINPFNVTSLFVYPLKISKSLWLSDVFRSYKKGPVKWHGLTSQLKKADQK